MNRMQIQIGEYPVDRFLYQRIVELHCEYIAKGNPELSEDEVMALAYFEGLWGLAERIDEHIEVIMQKAPILNAITKLNLGETPKRKRGRPKKEK
ncbi:MAG: hypothetical protein VW683_03435 [Betaproteobacteria bacterium]